MRFRGEEKVMTGYDHPIFLTSFFLHDVTEIMMDVQGNYIISTRGNTKISLTAILT